MDTAKVFWSGRSQAVRLPKEYRVAGDEVRIRRHGAAIVLEPLPKDWRWLDALQGKLDPDVGRAAAEKSADQERPGLQRLFKP
ncbi:MAG: antitoxin [Pseudomonadota bacterium]